MMRPLSRFGAGMMHNITASSSFITNARIFDILPPLLPFQSCLKSHQIFSLKMMTSPLCLKGHRKRLNARPHQLRKPPILSRSTTSGPMKQSDNKRSLTLNSDAYSSSGKTNNGNRCSHNSKPSEILKSSKDCRLSSKELPRNS